MLSAVLLPHMTLSLVELVVGAANVALTLLVACDFAVCCHDTVLQGDCHYAQATRLLLHLAHALVCVAVGSTDGRQMLLLGRTLDCAVGVVLSEAGAWPNMSHLYSTPEIQGSSQHL